MYTDFITKITSYNDNLFFADLIQEIFTHLGQMAHTFSMLNKEKA